MVENANCVMDQMQPGEKVEVFTHYGACLSGEVTAILPIKERSDICVVQIADKDELERARKARRAPKATYTIPISSIDHITHPND